MSDSDMPLICWADFQQPNDRTLSRLLVVMHGPQPEQPVIVSVTPVGWVVTRVVVVLVVVGPTVVLEVVVEHSAVDPWVSAENGTSNMSVMSVGCRLDVDYR